MTVPLKIDFVSDVACPWCAIGLAGLEEALRRTAGVVSADITLQPFELNPDMAPDGRNVDEMLGGRPGADPARLAEMRQTVRDRAADVGLVFNQDASSRAWNTFDAHRLLHWAKPQGRQLELKRALFAANFSDNANISDREVLVATAARAGLDADAAREVLDSGQYATEVRAAEEHWRVRVVPSIVINGEYLITGGLPPDQFETALRQIAEETAAQSSPA